MKHVFVCPVCKDSVDGQHYHNGGCLEEEYFICPEGHYAYEYSYGYTSISVFDKEFFYSWDTSPDEVIKIGTEIESYIKEKLND